MRRAAFCICLCGIATLALAEHRVQEFGGITARFKLLNPSVRLNEPLKVEITLHNPTDHSVAFRRFTLSQHIDVYCCGGERVVRKLSVPFSKSAVHTIALKPGDTLRRTEEIPLSSLYELAAGDYGLGFRYDLRLLASKERKPYQTKLQSQDVVAWDDTLYDFHVRP